MCWETKTTSICVVVNVPFILFCVKVSIVLSVNSFDITKEIKSEN